MEVEVIRFSDEQQNNQKHISDERSSKYSTVVMMKTRKSKILELKSGNMILCRISSKKVQQECKQDQLHTTLEQMKDI